MQDDSLKLSEDLCIVDVDQQLMQVNCKNGFHKVFSISTAINGINNKINSNGTPIGKHKICEKIGDNALLYSIFKARKNTGEICRDLNQNLDQDLILTRILRLIGDEPGINKDLDPSGICVDSYQRHIYIHGTNQENLLGKRSSKGCIRMGNQDIVELFSNIEVGAVVYILKSQNKLKT